MEKRTPEQIVRQEAVERYLRGEAAEDVCKDLGRSVRWLRKWVQRKRAGQADWYVEQSRAPHRVHNKTDEAQEQKIVAIRKELMANPQAQIGPTAVQWRFVREGDDPPGRGVIHRVLEEYDLIRKPKRYKAKGIPYPSLNVENPGICHQMDVLGPRYLKGGDVFYAFNAIDSVSREAAINVIRRKDDRSLVAAMVETWCRMGRPRYVQMDNTLSLHGSHRYPHSFGFVIRLLLELGVAPIFIPISEPWHNGIVEHFQDVFDKSFFRTETFKDYDDLVAGARQFEEFHNETHCYSALDGKPPTAYLRDHPSQAESFSETFQIPQKLFLRKGKVQLVRFVRSDLRINIFGEKFTLTEDFQYSYVTATVHVRSQRLRVRQCGTKVEKMYQYEIPKTPLLVPPM